jgi:hypothetical protein
MTYSTLQGIALKLSQETKITGASTGGGEYSSNIPVHSDNEINFEYPC